MVVVNNRILCRYLNICIQNQIRTRTLRCHENQTIRSVNIHVEEKENLIPKDHHISQHVCYVLHCLLVFKGEPWSRLYTLISDAPEILQFRIVDMFISMTEPDHKSDIIVSFKANEHLGVVVAPVAFRMGVDFPNIRQVVCIEMPDDISSYVQESGREGRESRPAMATLF